MSGKVTTVGAARVSESRQALAAMIAGDERRASAVWRSCWRRTCRRRRGPEPDGWMSTREAAEYAGTTTHALHKAMAAREIEFEQEVRGGKAWFRRGVRRRVAARRAAGAGGRHERYAEAAAAVADR